MPAAIVPFLSTIASYFLSDDFGLIRLLHDQPPEHFLALFAKDWTEGIYGLQYDELRPIIALSYRIDALFGPTNPVGYHISNLLLHTANTLLVYCLAAVATNGRRGVALSAGLLFALLPAHAEAVTWISGRADLIPTFAFLASLVAWLLFRRRGGWGWYLCSLGLFALALFAKQSAILVPVLLAGYDWLLAPARGARAPRLPARELAVYAPFLLMVGAYLVLRRLLFGQMVREDMLGEGLWAQFAVRQIAYLWGLLLPDDPARTLQTAPNPVHYAQLVGIAAGGYVASVAGLWAILRQEERGLHLRLIGYFGLLWYVVAVAPLLVVPYFSLRHLYFASVGTAIFLPLLWLTPWQRSLRQVATGAFLAVLLAAHGAELWRANGAWQAAAQVSERALVDFEAMGAELPAGSRVVLAVPPQIGGGKLWSFALPFALSEPFSHRSLYSRLDIVEHPDAYCCALLWARHRLPRIEEWIRQPDGRPLVVVRWNASEGMLDINDGSIGPEIGRQVRLLRELEAAHGGSLYRESRRLFAMLAGEPTDDAALAPPS